MPRAPLPRRTFLQLAALTAASRPSLGAAAPRWTAAIIGHTGRGNFGHGMDVVFEHRPDVQVLAVSDPDPAGRAKAQARAKAARSYADFRTMLERERPQLVSVGPRHTDQHHAMVSAALEHGAHVYCEKPFTTTLAEADDLVSRARAADRRIAVAHQGRLAPDTLALKGRIDDGALGELLEIRVHGKQDRRAGGEDMVVLGTHQFDLVRYFLGADATWCTARILQGGREVTRADARKAGENIGRVIGDEIEALLAFPRGINVHYTSRARNASVAGAWGMELIGTKARARLLSGPRTIVALTPAATPHLKSSPVWEPLSDPASHLEPPGMADTTMPNRWVVDDWLAAIDGRREPACSDHAARQALELIHGVFAAGLSRGRVPFPLADRQHPLA